MQSSHRPENGLSPQSQDEATEAASANTTPLVKSDSAILKTGWIENLRRAIGLRPFGGLKGTHAPFKERAKFLADALLSERGEVLGTVIAHDLARLIAQASPEELRTFAHLIAESYAPDHAKLSAAIDAWRAAPTGANLTRLVAAVEPPRQELFRRMNMAPGGTATLVEFRKFLLTQLASDPELAQVDADLTHLFASWFNRGFLEMRRIDWQSSAAILEKLIAYEAVHAIAGWDDLRRRLAADRRCFAFFHPALPDEPLIFIEVALVNELSDKIDPIIHAPMPSERDTASLTAPTHAIFYSISNCQAGLRGVSFGNFLIKQVAADLARELPSLKVFSTLSPIPTFRAWLDNPATPWDNDVPQELAQALMQKTGADSLRDAIEIVATTSSEDKDLDRLARAIVLRLAAQYITGDVTQRPNDPVARFHLGNGARVERVNWQADLSPKGQRESFGIMVNYLYDLNTIEANHEAFANRRPVARSKQVADLIQHPTGRGLSLFRK